MNLQTIKQKGYELAREMRAVFYRADENVGLRRPLAINTQKFANAIGKHLGYEIESRTTAELGEHILAMLLRKEEPKKAIVLIADSNNECWRRFVYIKEICHLFIDEARPDKADVESVVLALLERDEESELYESELLAAFAAIEIMIPEDLQNTIAHWANVEHETAYQIAFKLKAPKKFVEMRMREWSIEINN